MFQNIVCFKLILIQATRIGGPTLILEMHVGGSTGRSVRSVLSLYMETHMRYSSRLLNAPSHSEKTDRMQTTMTSVVNQTSVVHHPSIVHHTSVVHHKFVVHHSSVVHYTSFVQHTPVVHHSSVVHHTSVVHHRSVVLSPKDSFLNFAPLAQDKK